MNSTLDNLPDYLYRPDDFAIFYKVEHQGEITYQHEHSFERGYHGHGHKYETLIACDFKPCTKADFKELAAKKKEYYEWLSWSCRSDGHGGSKGGTMEEYRNRKIYLPIKLKGEKSHE